MPPRGGVGLHATPRASAAIPNALYLSGFSSGGHLGGCVVITEWEKQGLPRDILKGAVLGSGMYDLKPVRMSARSSYVKFTDEMEQALSAMRHLDKVHTPLVLTIGLLETPEFQRQSRDFAAALTKAGKPVKLIAAKGHNHFEMGESLSNPYGIMGRAAMEMMKLNDRSLLGKKSREDIHANDDKRSPAARWSPAPPPARSRSPPIPPRRSAARRRRRAPRGRRCSAISTRSTSTRATTTTSMPSTSKTIDERRVFNNRIALAAARQAASA